MEEFEIIKQLNALNYETTGSVVKDLASMMRSKLKEIELLAREMSSYIKNTSEDLGDKGEVIAQSMLAMRSIEESRMRFGKVIQYSNKEHQDSVYDKKA